MIKTLCFSIFLSLFFQILFPSNLAAQRDTIYIPKIYNTHSEPHVIARGGSVILNESDSLHLISNSNFQLLGDLLKDIALMDTLFQDLELLHARDNRVNQEMIDKLNLLLDESLRVNQIATEISNERINEVIPSLEDSEKLLLEAQANLISANEHLEQLKKSRKRRSFHYAAGGITAGLLIGLIIGN